MSSTQIEQLDVASSTLTLSVDGDLYPREVVFAAAYVFLDRAYVVLDKIGARILVHLRGKQAIPETELRALGGEFENELLAQALRRRVVKANWKIIDTITSLAIGSAAGAPALVPAGPSADPDADEGGDPVVDTLDFLDDPLGIAKPWEPEKKEG